MDYNLFKQIISCRIREFLPPMYEDFEPVIESVDKINEKKDALIMRPKHDGGAQALPMTYLDDMYILFREIQDLDEVLRFIANIIVNFTGYYKGEDVEFDFCDKKDKIIMNLVNTEMNSKLLKSIPHVEVNNMSVIFRIIVNEQEGGFNSVIINDDIFESLEMSLTELIDLAKENTRNLFPEHIVELDEGVVVLSNEANLFGSVNILYKDIMKEVSSRLDDDFFYIIPSSIHEVIAVSRSVADVEKLIGMLAEGNCSITMDRDILSNAIYQYDCGDNSIKMIASYRQNAC